MEKANWAEKRVHVSSLLDAMNQQVPRNGKDETLIKPSQQITMALEKVNEKAKSAKIKKFCDSDNILLSVQELEHQRKKEKAEKLQEIQNSLRNTPDAFVDAKTHNKISVSVPHQSGEKGIPPSTSAGSKSNRARLQLTHRSQHESVRNIANSAKIAALVDQCPPDDTIDIVVAANDPAERYKYNRTFSPPIIKISSAGPPYNVQASQSKHGISEPKLEMDRPYSTFPSFPRSISKETINYDVISEPTTPNSEKDSPFTLLSRSHSRESERRRSKSKIPFHYSVDPNINKKAYDKALFNARNKYFKHVPLNKILTKPFEFSYFSLLDPEYALGTEKRLKKPYGMKRIFGEIKPDDFYPVNKTRSENS